MILEIIILININNNNFLFLLHTSPCFHDCQSGGELRHRRGVCSPFDLLRSWNRDEGRMLLWSLLNFMANHQLNPRFFTHTHTHRIIIIIIINALSSHFLALFCTSMQQKPWFYYCGYLSIYPGKNPLSRATRFNWVNLKILNTIFLFFNPTTKRAINNAR